MLVVTLLVLLVVGSAHQANCQCLTAQDFGARPHDSETRDKLTRSQLDFSLALLKTVASTAPGSQNVFISPVSVYNAMLLAYFTAGGHTEASIKNMLNLPRNQDKVDMMLSYRHQGLSKVHANGTFKEGVNLANRLYISVNQTLRDCMETLFHDEIDRVDFGSKHLFETVDKINAWVANKTNNQIQDLLSADLVSPNTQIILTNVAYFKGSWKDQFDERDTRLSKFYVSKNKTVNTPMMFQLNTFNHYYSEELKTDVLELPYKGKEISMMILLPDEDKPMIDVLRRLDSTSLFSIINQVTNSNDNNREKLEVRMPKFTIERTVELVPILEKMGVGDLFKTTSDLTGLTGGPKVLFSGAIHKAKLSVDEIGTEAAAATAFTDTRIPSEGFNVNRPYMYFLYDHISKTMLFCGITFDPTL